MTNQKAEFCKNHEKRLKRLKYSEKKEEGNGYKNISSTFYICKVGKHVVEIIKGKQIYLVEVVKE